MGWAKVDDRYATHPKLRAAGGGGERSLMATGLDARAISHCAGYETDGFISDADLLLITGLPAKRAKVVAGFLVDVGRWHRAPADRCECWTSHSPDDQRAGYWVHDFLDPRFNKSHAQLLAEREADRVRKLSSRTKGGRPAGVQPDSNGVSARNPPGPSRERGRGPASRPVPSRPDQHSSAAEHQSVGDPGGAAAADEQDQVNHVARLVAEMRLQRQPAGSVRNPGGWLRRVSDETADEFGLLIAAELAGGATPEQAADAVDRHASEPGGSAGDGRCDGCGQTLGTPCGPGCPKRVEWVEGPDGLMVRR